MLNKLEIREVFAPDEFEGRGPFFEFFIDGKALSTLLKIDRFALSYSSVGLDLVSKSLRLSNYLLGLQGRGNAENQIDPGRPVLYGCHCGCDYCGIVSLELEINAGVVRWSDIRFHDEEVEHLPADPDALELSFTQAQYESTLEEHASRT